MNSNAKRYYAAACQLDLPHPKRRDEIPARVQTMLNMISYAVTGYEPFHDVRLVVFPEFAHAALVMPDAPSPIATRELFYTAVTRAKQLFTLVESRPAITQQVVRSRTQRASRLFCEG